MKKFLSLILSSIIITTCFSGCGSSSTENSANEEVSNEYEEETKGGGIFNVADETEQTEEITDTIEQTEETTEVYKEETKTVVSNMNETDKKDEAFDITVDEFVTEFNKRVPRVLDDDSMKLKYNSTNDNYNYYNDIVQMSFFEKNGKVDCVYVAADVSPSYFAGENFSQLYDFFEVLMSPYLVFNKYDNATDLYGFVLRMESTENENTITFQGNDENVKYTIILSSLGFLGTIQPLK